MSTFLMLFCTELSLTIMVSNYIQYKNVSSQSFWTSKHYIFLNRSIWPIDGTLTGANTPGRGRPGSNGNERMTTHSQKL